MHRRQIVDYLALALIWGGSFLLLVHVVAAFGWAAAVSLRSLIASALLLVIARAGRRRLTFGHPFHLAVVGSTIMAGQLAGLSIATPRIGTAMTAIFVAGIPLISMVIGQLWGVEHITPAGRVGLVVGAAGMVMLVGFPAVEVTRDFVVGCLAMAGGAVCAAFGNNYARKYLRHIGSWEQAIGAFAFSGVLTLPLLVPVPIPHTPRPVDWLYLVALAGLCSATAYALYFGLVAQVGPTTAVSVEFMVALVAVAIGAGLLHERLSPLQVLGGVAIVLGCAMVLGLLPRTRQPVSASPTRR